MLRMGGRPDRTYVSGETLRATSSRLAAAPTHWAAYDRALGPPSISATSVMPYQLMMAATLGTVVSSLLNPPPAQARVNPAVSGIMPAARARCPPADSPVTTTRLV